MAVKPLEFNTIRNGFCVARPNKTYAVLFNGSGILTEKGNINIPRPNNNQDVIWLDLSPTGKIAGTSQQVDNIAWEWNGTSWKGSKCYSVPRACIYKDDNLITVQTPGETGSMGYIQVSDSGLLIKTDDQYSGPPLWEYIIRGNVTVGHGDKGSAGDNPLLCKIDGIVRLLEKGNCLCIKFYREIINGIYTENCAIAWINNNLSKVWFPTVAELKTFPIYNPSPEPIPVPTPVPNGLESVKKARIKYNDIGAGPKRAWTVTNAAAWAEKANGAGMFFKDSGTEYNDRNINCILYKHRPGIDPAGKGEMYDVLRDAEGIAEPRWARTNPSGYGDITKWRASEEPEESEEPNPIPTNPDRDMLIHIRDEINEFLGEN